MRIRTKLLMLLLIVVVLVSAGITTVSSKVLIDNLVKDIKMHLEEEASRRMLSLDIFLRQRFLDMKMLVTPTHDEMSGEYTIQEKIEFLRELERTSKVYLSISMYDTNGIRIGDTRNVGVGLSESLEPFFQNALNGEFYMDSTPVFSENFNTFIIHFSGPIRDHKNASRIIGVVASRVSVAKLNDVTKGTTEKEHLMHLDILDKEGLLLFSNYNKKDILKKRMNNLEVYKTLTDENVQTASGIVKHDEHDVLIVGVKEQGWLDFKGNNWVMLLGLDMSDVYANVYRLIWTNIGIALAFVIVIIPLSIFLARAISKPIEQLQKAASEARKGNLDIKTLIKTKDELQDVGEAFNKMISGLKLWQQRTQQKSKALDRTLRKLQQSYRKLKQLDALKNEFIQSVAHSIRTPLTSMIGFIELIKEQKFGKLTKKQLQAVDAVNNETNRLNRIITKMILTSRIESGEKMQCGKTDLNALVLNTAKKYKDKAKEKGIALLTTLGKIPAVNADTNWLTLVIENLIDNAIKFTPKGNIVISTRKTNNDVEFSVKDTGTGIPKKFLPFVFTKFFQVTHTASGSGLGLYLSYKIIKAHNGKILIKSEYGKGSTFAFQLPVSRG